MNRDECKAACRLHHIISNRRNLVSCKESVVSAHSMKACTGLVVHQVVFTDVQITIGQRAAVLPVLKALRLLAYTKQMLPLTGCS